MAASSHSTPSLPVRLMPLIGREADVEGLLNLMQNPSVRLLTILGAGGIGKTSLAIEVARVLQGQFQDGAVLVPLAQLSLVDEFLPAVAGVLGVQLPPGGDLQEALLHHISSRNILLVLDNFEHLLDEASLLDDILVQGPRVKILVTSREKLNLEAETLYHLGGLGLPPADTLQNVTESDAACLFLQKANQVRSGFSLNEDNASAIARICRLVDGNPLGILLASAWTEYFSPTEIAGEITNSVDFLSNESRDSESRHCCMRAVFDSSYNRLDERLKAVFMKLAIFRGGFDLVAAEAVADADLRTLIALVDKSLLTRDLHTGRYELHELLRQYADEKLTSTREEENIRSAHADYYASFVHSRERKLISASQTQTLDEIQADFDNIRQAFTRVVEKRDFKSARAVIAGLYAFCDMRSWFYEGEALFRLASEKLAPRPGEALHPAWALALLSWYDMRLYIERLESYEEITTQAKGCLEMARSMEDPEGTAASLVLLGAIAGHQNDYRTALRHYEEAVQVCPALDDFYWIHMRIGLCRQSLRDYPGAIQAFQTSLQRGKKTGERVKMGWSLVNLGDTLMLQGNAAEAKQHLEQGLKQFQEVGTTVGILWSNHSLGRLAMSRRDMARAQAFAETASGIAQQLHSASWIRKTDDLLRQIDPEFHGASTNAARQAEEETFSSRELEVLQLLKSELNGPEIAERLVVSLNTVRYHTKNIYRKLGANTRLEAIQRAKEFGL